jgi:hypothetical protein
MQEAVRRAGLRAVGQRLCLTEAEVRAFVAALPAPAACVVKPNESAGTDSVFLCAGAPGADAADQAAAGFHRIHGLLNGLGARNEGALVQEFLAGTEYVLDGVCRDGVYKVGVPLLICVYTRHSLCVCAPRDLLTRWWLSGSTTSAV